MAAMVAVAVVVVLVLVVTAVVVAMVAAVAVVAVAVAVVARAPAGLEGGAASPGVGSACAMSGARLRGIATLPSPAA